MSNNIMRGLKLMENIKIMEYHQINYHILMKILQKL